MIEDSIPITADTDRKNKVKIIDHSPLEYTMNVQKKCGDTEMSYAEFAKMKRLPGMFIRQFTVTISDKNNPEKYMEITTSKVEWDTNNLQAAVEIIRDTAFEDREVEVEFEYKTILFTTGAAFKQWIDVNKLDASELEEKGVIRQK